LSNRIASKHKYGEDWSTAQSSLIVILDDSEPNWDLQVHDVRLEVQSYAADDATAMDTWMALVALSRDATRELVTTSKGDALVYSFLPESGPSYFPDKDLDMMKRILSFWRIQVYEAPVV